MRWEWRDPSRFVFWMHFMHSLAMPIHSNFVDVRNALRDRAQGGAGRTTPSYEIRAFLANHRPTGARPHMRRSRFVARCIRRIRTMHTLWWTAALAIILASTIATIALRSANATAPGVPSTQRPSISQNSPGDTPQTITFDQKRYAVGSVVDQVLIGNWRCDARPLPVLREAKTQYLYLFDAWAQPGQSSYGRKFASLQSDESIEKRTRSSCDELVARNSLGNERVISIG